MNNYKTTKLKNGLKVITINLPHYKTCSIIASVKVGSKNETKENNGVAHFLEHVNFKGTPSYKNINILTKELDSMGCSFNAYTMKHVTVYHFKVAYQSDYISKIFHILSEMLFESIHRKKDLESERNIIIEEIKKILDDPNDCIDDYIAEMIFADSPLALTISGDIKTIKNMKPEVIRKFYKDYYVPNNTIISVCGKLPVNIDKIIQKYFNKYPSKPLKVMPIIPYHFATIKPELKILTRRDDNQCHINISFPAFPINDKRVYTLELLALHLAGNMSSILYQELRDKNNLVYSVNAYVITYEEGGYLTIETSVDPKNINKTIKIILTELNNLHIDNFKNLNALKINQIHSEEMDWEDSYNVADHYSEQLLFYPIILNLKEHAKCYQNVSTSDMKDVVKNVIDFRKMKVVIIGNIKKDDVQLTKLLHDASKIYP